MVVKSLAGVWNEIACRRIHIKHYTKKIIDNPIITVLLLLVFVCCRFSLVACEPAVELSISRFSTYTKKLSVLFLLC